jgi:hypothetical protein
METKQYWTLDTSDLPQGEWMHEPDKKQWEDPETGLPCLALRGRIVAWCGYVGIDDTHPFYGLHYEDIPSLDAHGGVTYSGPGWGHGKAEEINDPDFRDRALYFGIDSLSLNVDTGSDERKPLWFFGFDCAHAGDYYPLPLSLTNRYRNTGLFKREDWEVYKNLAFVERSVKELALDLEAHKHDERPEDHSAEREARSKEFQAMLDERRKSREKSNVVPFKRYGYHRTRTRRKKRRT